MNLLMIQCDLIMMCVKTVIAALICYLFFINGAEGVSIVEPPHTCDRASFRSHLTREGVIGQTALFSWYGLLKVYLRDIDSMTEAVTGIVLIKDHYAIANADDIAKIPEKIFIESSEAMFVPRDNKAQYYSLRGYLTHPEYPAGGATLAILDLHTTKKHFPILPICQPLREFNALNELYTLGFTDDNGPLEKFLYKMEYVDPKTCKTFYEFAELKNENSVPDNRSMCASAKNLRADCVWDTGTALVSNVTGRWALIGLGVRGPGCAAPAHFISLAPYWPWILSHTSLTGDQERHVYQQGFKEHRRRYGGSAYLKELAEPQFDSPMHAKPMHDFTESTPEAKDVPLHEVLRQDFGPEAPPGTTPGTTPVAPPAASPTTTDTKTNEHLSHYYQNWMEEDMFQIERLNETEIHIIPATGTGKGRWGNCTAPGLKLVFKDHVNVTVAASSEMYARGSIQYKISLFDLWFTNYTCITIKVYAQRAQHAYLQYTVGMHDGGDIFPWTPEEILKYTPLIDPLADKTDPYAKMSKHIITSPMSDSTVRSMMLYLKVLFATDARLEMAVYGPPEPMEVGFRKKASEGFTTPGTFFINHKDDDDN